MAVVRVALAMIVLSAAAYAVRSWVYAPFQCNRAEKQAELATEWAEKHSESFRGVEVGRQTIERMKHCIDVCPTSVDAYMVAAANDFILERLPEAIGNYEAALRYDRRPEIYYELGLAYLEAGQRERATSALFVWNLFYGQHTQVIPDPVVRADVETRTKSFFAQGSRAQLPAALRDN
jgi:tetratricopeptide (TPR) repeat protein